MRKTTQEEKRRKHQLWVSSHKIEITNYQRDYRAKHLQATRAKQRLYAKCYRLRRAGWTVRLVEGKIQVGISPLNITKEHSQSIPIKELQIAKESKQELLK